MTIQNARGTILLTKERAVEHISTQKKENPELALGVFCVLAVNLSSIQPLANNVGNNTCYDRRNERKNCLEHIPTSFLPERVTAFLL